MNRGLVGLYRAALFVALAGAVGTSGWINVQASDGTPAGVVLGVLAPAGYLVAAGVGELIPVRRRLDVGFLSTILVALLTMGSSWWHGFELALAHRQPPVIAGAIALVPEATVMAILGAQRRLGLLRDVEATEAGGPTITGALRERMLAVVTSPTATPPPPEQPHTATVDRPAPKAAPKPRRRSAGSQEAAAVTALRAMLPDGATVADLPTQRALAAEADVAKGTAAKAIDQVRSELEQAATGHRLTVVGGNQP